MIPTQQSDDIHDFLEFFAHAVGTKAASDRKGAAEADIDRFQAVARLPLPTLYIGYLREFGERDPVLQIGNDGHPDLKSLLKVYERWTRSQERGIPQNAVLISGAALDGQRMLWYSEAGEKGPDEPTVVKSWGGRVSATLAQSVRNYIYRLALLRGSFSGVPLFLHQNDDSLFEDTNQAVIDCGFESYWFTDKWQKCLWRSDGSSLVMVSDDDGIAVYGSCPNETTQSELLHRLLQLGLIASPVAK